MARLASVPLCKSLWASKATNCGIIGHRGRVPFSAAQVQGYEKVSSLGAIDAQKFVSNCNCHCGFTLYLCLRQFQPTKYADSGPSDLNNSVDDDRFERGRVDGLFWIVCLHRFC